MTDVPDKSNIVPKLPVVVTVFTEVPDKENVAPILPVVVIVLTDVPCNT